MTDKDQIQQNAIKKMFPCAKLLLYAFHTEQDFSCTDKKKLPQNIVERNHLR